MPATEKQRLSPIKIILRGSLLLFCFFIAFFIYYGVGDDTVFYTEEDRILYYLNTPEVFKQLPRVSEKISYSTRIPDGGGGFQAFDITFHQVPDLQQAEQQLAAFFQQHGYQLTKLAKVAHVYAYYLPQDGLTPYKTPIKEYVIIPIPKEKSIMVQLAEILD